MVGEPKSSRRGLLIGALALGAVAWGWQRFAVGRERLDFAPIDGLPGWRQVSAGPVTSPGGSATSAVFVGIGDQGAPIEPLPAEKLCSVLFRAHRGSDVPLAMFTDFFCPYCRILTGRVVALGLPVTWHQLPLLGPSSEIAARAAAAAELQEGYEAFQQALLAAPFRPTLAFFAQAAARAGLSPEQLLVDMNSTYLARRLTESRATAETLGIWGTPALVIGRTLILGEVGADTLARLVAIEREDGAWRSVCA